MLCCIKLLLFDRPVPKLLVRSQTRAEVASLPLCSAVKDFHPCLDECFCRRKVAFLLHGVWYYVRNKHSLWQLAKDNGVKPGNFSQLVGLRKNSSCGLPQQKAGWQLRQRMWWIARDPLKLACGLVLDAVPAVPFSSADGDKWVDLMRAVHKDCNLDGKRLHTLAHKGVVPSHDGEKVDCYRGWRKVSEPSDVELIYIQHGPYAKPAEATARAPPAGAGLPADAQVPHGLA